MLVTKTHLSAPAVSWLQATMKESCTLHLSDGGPVDAFCGYFDVLFKGSAENPTDVEVRLTTAPDPTGATHWGQQTFYVHPPVECAPSDKLTCGVEVSRRTDNHRLLKVQLAIKVEGSSVYAERSTTARTLEYNID